MILNRAGRVPLVGPPLGALAVSCRIAAGAFFCCRPPMRNLGRRLAKESGKILIPAHHLSNVLTSPGFGRGFSYNHRRIFFDSTAPASRLLNDTAVRVSHVLQNEWGNGMGMSNRTRETLIDLVEIKLSWHGSHRSGRRPRNRPSGTLPWRAQEDDERRGGGLSAISWQGQPRRGLNSGI